MNSPENELAEVRTLVDLLEFRAGAASDRTAFYFLQDGETESAALKAPQLRTHARRIALQLREIVSPGDRALLLFPPGLDFIAAFFASLYAGVIAVPCYPPKRNRFDTRLQAIVGDAQPAIVLAPASVIEQVRDRQSVALGDRNLKWLATDIAGEGTGDPTDFGPDNGSTDREIRPERLAFLQYTSGSTSTPKGVMVSHGNLMANLRDLDLGWRHDPESMLVTWLPIFHDLGLIYGVLMPIYRGFKCYMMPPTAFLRSPWLWLNAISRFRGTHSAAPNFAYDICVDSITTERQACLDLQSWRCSLNGAEPVRETTCKRFYEVFRRCGLHENVICPGYGLAESTLKVASQRCGSGRTLFRADAEALAKNRVVPASADSRSTRELISCGSSEIDTQIAIVDPESLRRCPPGVVGEIWVSGQSVAQGYWNRPEVTAEVFRAFTEGDGPFLRTGDLGFMRDGEIYVTGRLKDIVIVRGFNHYPQDIEATTKRADPALRANAGAAFSIECNSEERLVIVQEVERTHVRKLEVEAVAAAVRAAIAEEHQIQLDTLVLVKPGAIPKTSSGKIRRSAAKALFEAGKIEGIIAEWHAPAIPTATTSAASTDVGESQPGMIAEAAPRQIPGRRELEDWLISFCSGLLGVAQTELDPTEPLSRYGMDSIAAVDLAEGIGRHLRRQVEPGVAYDYPTIVALAAHFAGKKQGATSLTAKAAQKGFDSRKENIAIIGIGCRFPGAPNPAAFWELLETGRSAVGCLPLHRPGAERFYAIAAEPGLGHIVQGGFLDSVDQFDGAFFGIGPREAESLDPQQRLLLEVSWEALEEAGLPPDELAGSRTGVFVGISTNDYGRFLSDCPDEHAGKGNAFSVAANRLSYVYDWCGPSFAIDTACSSALVAVHQACASLRGGECDLALAGGVNLILSPHWSVSFARAGMLAPDGKCKTFDAGAAGYVRGEGCGVVILQRLVDSVRDGHRVLAVIRGSAVNQDGRSNGLTAPNSVAQRDVISRALASAGVAPDQVSYVEAHGTGTQLGDPIELEALRDVLFSKRDRQRRCWIGSVKTNIGHLEAAAGIAGLIKVVLALVNRAIPAHLHLSQLNPKISCDDVFPLIPRELQGWERNGRRIAAVSSFGFGGTNAHAVLEEADTDTGCAGEVPGAVDRRAPLLLALSAKSPESLCEIAAAYRRTFREERATEVEVGAVVRAACMHRGQLVYRAALVAEDREALESGLNHITIDSDLAAQKARNDGHWLLATGHARRPPRVAFLFTGQGSQYTGMAREMYETEPVFRAALKRCEEVLENSLPVPLLHLLHDETHRLALNQTACTQPALFALEYALCELWRSWGVVPHAVLGHSVGEYAAACTAGVFDFETGLRLIAERGRLMQALPANGGMAAVFAPASHVSEFIAGSACDIEVAAINGPNETVISGRSEAVDAACHRLEAAGARTQKLQASHAFHSRLIEPILQPFTEFLSRHSFSAPAIPFVSNLTGQSESEVFARPDYWASHARRAVLFSDGAAALDRLGCEAFVEIGPNAVLIGLARRALTESAATFVASLRRGRSDRRQMSEAAAEIFVSGARISWHNYYQRRATEHVPLPSYPFQRKRYWLGKSQSQSPETECIYEITWERAARARQQHTSTPVGRWIVTCDECGTGDRIAEELRRKGQYCIRIRLGLNTEQTAADEWRIALEDADPFSRILNQLARTLKEDKFGVVHCWGIRKEEGLSGAILQKARGVGCVPALQMFQALRRLEPRVPARVWLLTQGCQSPGQGLDSNGLSQSMLWGLGRSLAIEWPELWGGLHDLSPNPDETEVERLVAELLHPSLDQVAWSRTDGWIPRLQHWKCPTPPAQVAFRADGAYWITGGWGAIGLRVAKWLAQRGAGLIVLSARSEPTSEASAFAEECGLRGVRAWLHRADCADAEATLEIMREIELSEFSLRGVFHTAGVAGFRNSSELDIAEFDRVCRAKVEGAWNFHQVTLERELDHFVLFSSIASVWGSKGQAHYSAANHFLDRLAFLRSTLGLPGLVVNWGPWAGPGMAESGTLQMLEKRGIFRLTPEAALRSLETLMLNGGVTEAIVARVDWPRFVPLFTSLPRRDFFDHVLGEEVPQGHAGETKTGRAVSILATMSGAERREELLRRLGGLVGEQLGYQLGQLPSPQTGFFDLGMDSVMAIEFRRRIEQEFGLQMSATLIFDYPNLDRLADHLEETLFSVPEVRQPDVRFGTSGDDRAQIEDEQPLDGLILERLSQLETLLSSGRRPD
jgi:acyl transferase domain-containing protein/acyl-CoA synthetase (AMP-forming)/AMP-acid ligase II/acyl carrier protein